MAPSCCEHSPCPGRPWWGHWTSHQVRGIPFHKTHLTLGNKLPAPHVCVQVSSWEEPAADAVAAPDPGPVHLVGRVSTSQWAALLLERAAESESSSPDMTPLNPEFMKMTRTLLRLVGHRPGQNLCEFSQRQSLSVSLTDLANVETACSPTLPTYVVMCTLSTDPCRVCYTQLLEAASRKCLIAQGHSTCH